MAPLIVPSITRELIAADIRTHTYTQGVLDKSRPRIAPRWSSTTRYPRWSSSHVTSLLLFGFRPPPPGSRSRLITFQSLVALIKGQTLGTTLFPTSKRRPYLHFPPLSSPPLRRGKRPRFRARNQATKRSFLGNNGRINAFRQRQDSWYTFLASFTKVRPSIQTNSSLRNGGSWHSSFTKTR